MFRLCIGHLNKQSQQVNSQCCSALLTTALPIILSANMKHLKIILHQAEKRLHPQAKKKHTPVFGSAWCSPRCSHALHGIHRMQNACRVPALIWGTDVEKKDVEKNTHTHKLKTKGGPRSTFMKLKQNSLSVFCNPSFPIISASPHSVPQWKKHVGDRPGCRASQVPVLNAAGLIAKTGG